VERRKLKAVIVSTVFLLVAPGVVAGVGPWLVTRWHMRGPLALHAIGALLIAAGALVLLRAFVRFVVEGVGTPAPVAEPERLVIGGLYRYVRNPMYIAVGATIVGEAAFFGQPVLLAYAAAFWVITAAFVHFYEEPHLKRRYGAEYEAYSSTVPAWLPRRPRRRVAM
jgi:protein-S-isoprenylcysteine O-methyltransferase Ste14